MTDSLDPVSNFEPLVEQAPGQRPKHGPVMKATPALSASADLDITIEEGPWRDTARSPEQRAELLVEQLTLDEKLLMIRGFNGGFLEGRSEDPLIGPMLRMIAGYVPGVPRLGIPAQHENDSTLGVGNGFDCFEARPGDEATAMPSGLAVSSTFEPELAAEHGRVVGVEQRARGVNVVLGPGLNLARDPRGGRNFEYVGGEDPLLAGVLAGELASGIQSQGLIATLKHFVAHGFSWESHATDVLIGEAALRESDLLAFEIAIARANPGAVMASYHWVNGERSCHHDLLNNRILKGDWGWRGYVMSDWGAVHGTVGAINGGLDSESAWTWDGKPYFDPEVIKIALANGEISAARLDDMARRILWAMLSTGVYDNPPEPGGVGQIDRDAHVAVARRIAERGTVLLRNIDDLLPLEPGVAGIAVIGGHADVGVLAGGGSSAVRPYGGFVKIDAEVPTFDQDWDLFVPGSIVEAIADRVDRRDVRWADGTDLAHAARMAREAEIAIVVVNQPNTEGRDAATLSLPDDQDALVRAVAEVNPKTVVLLQTGNPVSMPWLDDVAAVLATWYPGQAGADAVAGLLFGEASPSGRLPVTFPRAADQLPRPDWPGDMTGHDAPSPVVPWDDDPVAVLLTPDRTALAPLPVDRPTREVDYRIEGSEVGYRWFEATGAEPLFAFGFGLTYTTFERGDLGIDTSPVLRVAWNVTNTGSRRGADVGQVYVRPPGRRAARLAGWLKVDLDPGETRRVEVAVDTRVLASYDEIDSVWVANEGEYEVRVGSDAGDNRLAKKISLPRTVRETRAHQ